MGVTCPVRPLIRSSTCGTNSKIASSDSTAPVGEPGRLTIRTPPHGTGQWRGKAAQKGWIRSPFGTHQLAETRDFAIDHVASGFRGDVAGSDTRAAGCEDHVSRGSRQLTRRQAAISARSSGTTTRSATVKPACFKARRHSRPGLVGPGAPARTVADRHDRGRIITLEISALAAGLFEQVDVLDLDSLVERLGHVVDRERGDRCRGQRLHFDAGLRGGGGRGDHPDAVGLDHHLRHRRARGAGNGRAESARPSASRP